MSRRPAVLSPSMLRGAARAAVATAIAERTTSLSESEARNTSGGAPYPIAPVIAGMLPSPYPGGDPLCPGCGPGLVVPPSSEPSSLT